MATQLPFPQLQFCDDTGAPLVGGTVTCYTVNTLDLADTWKDAGQTMLNSNPITLDGGGRCFLFGDQNYDLLVKDVNGNTIIGNSPTYPPLDASTISTYMTPIVGALNQTQFLALTGLAAYIAAMVASIELMPGPQGIQGETGETGATGATGETGSGYSPTITGGNPVGLSFSCNGGTQVFTIWIGQNFASASNGVGSATFPTAYPNNCVGVICNTPDISWWANATSWNASGFTCITSSPLHGGGGSGWQGGPANFGFIAMGY